jgi:hypothetical protein
MADHSWKSFNRAGMLMSTENAHFPPAILVKKKPSFFTTAPCSHTTPRSHFMEESQAERGIARLGLGLDRQRKRG